MSKPKFESISKIIDLTRNFDKSMRHKFHHLMQDSDLTFPQLSVISMLEKHREQKVSELSLKIGLSGRNIPGDGSLAGFFII